MTNDDPLPYDISAHPANTARPSRDTRRLEALNRSRLSALNMMEDAVEAQRRLQRANEDLARAAAANNLLAATVEQSWDAILITDARMTVQYVNQAFEKLTGYSRSEIVGQPPWHFNRDVQSEADAHSPWRNPPKDGPVFARLGFRRKNGASYTADVLLSTVTDAAGGIVNYVEVRRDVTERLKMEDRLAHTQKMESVGRLAGGIAHDFNNMLGVILGNAELLIEKLPPGNPLREDAGAIVNAAKRSSAITRQLLAFAKKQIVTPRVLDLNTEISRCLSLLKRLLGENIELDWQPHAAACRVKLDPSQVDQILTNLCINARDAIASFGTIAIRTERVSIAPSDDSSPHDAPPGDTIVLSVADTGMGMTPEVLAQAFEPFFTTKSVGEGTGLGLATVHGIVSQNNGFIRAQSHPGGGTTIRIYLPEQTAPQPEPEPPNRQAVPLGNDETVLIVEDEPLLLNLAATMLERLGYRVLTAATPTAAFDLARRHAKTINLLLADVVMAEMNGKEMAQRLHGILPGLPVLFMSGYAADAMATHGVLEPGIQFISKPFSLHDIAVKLQATLHENEKE